MSASSRAVSEPMAIHPFLNGWNGHLHSGDIAWTRNHFNVGVALNDFYVGYVQRYDYVLRFNKQTAALYYRTQNDLPYSKGNWPVRLQAWHLRSQGIKFAWKWRVSNGFYIRPAITLLKGWAFQDGDASGVLAYQKGALRGKASLNYRYTHDFLFDHQFKTPSGQGITTDLTLGWDKEDHGAKLTFSDLYGRVWWQDTPYTNGHADTYDRGTADGVGLFPAFSGRRGSDNYQQSIPMLVHAHLWQESNHWLTSLDADYFLNRLWFTPGVSYRFAAVTPYIGYEVRQQQWLLGLQGHNKHWKLLLGSDKWKLNEARSLTLKLVLGVSW